MESVPVEILLKILEYLPTEDVVESRCINRRIGTVIQRNRTRFERPHFKLLLDMQRKGVNFTVVTPRFQGDLFIGEHAYLEGSLSHLFRDSRKERSQTTVLKAFFRWLKKNAVKMNKWGNPLKPSFDIPELVLDTEKLKYLTKNNARWLIRILKEEDIRIDLVRTTRSDHPVDGVPTFIDEKPLHLIKRLAKENVARRLHFDYEDVLFVLPLVKDCFPYFSESTMTTDSFKQTLELIDDLHTVIRLFSHDMENMEYSFTVVVGPQTMELFNHSSARAVELIKISESQRGNNRDDFVINGPEDIPSEMFFQEGDAWFKVDWILKENGSYIAKIAGII